MTRSRATAKAAGAAFERAFAKFLAWALDDDRVEVRRTNGINDRGDISAVRTIRGGKVVIECKNYTSDRIQFQKWLAEAEVERGNDDAHIGVVAVKPRGSTDGADALIVMTGATFANLLLGGPDDRPVVTPAAENPTRIGVTG
mgnify:FL=1